MKRARIWLIVWLLGLLFPLAALGRFSSLYQQAFKAIFGAEWVHVVMHALLYAMLSLLLTLALKLHSSRRSALLVLLIVLGVGAVQEAIQALSQGMELLNRTTLSLAFFDLGIDLLGGSLGLAALWLLATKLPEKALKEKSTTKTQRTRRSQKRISGNPCKSVSSVFYSTPSKKDL